MALRPSKLNGGLRVGARFFESRGVVRDAASEAPRGVVDRIGDLANARIDTGKIHASIVSFFEDTAGLDLVIESAWRFPFSIAWPFLRPLMRFVGQFVLPLRTARIETRAHAIDPEIEGRDDARAIVRTYVPDGSVFQVVSYATHERESTRYMSAAFPLPFGHVLGILRLDERARDGDEITGVMLTSARRDGDDAGVRFVLGSFVLPSPFGERLELFAPHAAPSDIERSVMPDATLLGRHEQRLFGVRFVTHRYWFKPARGASL